MSWSVMFIGKPENVAKALQAHSETLFDQSKVEYDDALPHLVALVEQNFNDQAPQLVKITASGYGYAVDGVQRNRNITVGIEPMYGGIV